MCDRKRDEKEQISLAESAVSDWAIDYHHDGNNHYLSIAAEMEYQNRNRCRNDRYDTERPENGRRDSAVALVSDTGVHAATVGPVVVEERQILALVAHVHRAAEASDTHDSWTDR